MSSPPRLLETNLNTSAHNGGNSCTCGREQSVSVCVRVLTFAGLRVGFEDEAFGAGAGVGTWRVSAQAVVTQQTVDQTLVDVCGEDGRRNR